MCGHGMVSHALAKKMIDWVKEGRRTPEQAAAYLTRFCSCGVFNPARAARAPRASGPRRSRMKTVWSWIVRALVVLVCAFLTARSARMAVSDLRAQRNGMQGLESAIALEPGDSVLQARAALLKSNSGDMSQAVDQQLLHASELDPLNSDLPMALGIRDEFRGNTLEAERDLVHAAAIDRTFKPAWSLANFYFRIGRPEKAWPMIQRALNLNPLGFDPTPVFDLCWNESGDSKKILGLIPGHGTMPLQYLYYLMYRRRTQAAIEFWPRALEVAGPPDQGLIGLTVGFVELLEQANRMPDAVRVWNQIVDRRIVESGRLNPEAGVSVADPDFRFPPIERAFGWRVANEAGVSVAQAPSALRFEFDGNEPESSVLLTTVAPLVPSRAYRLIWKTDSSRLHLTRDPGFALQIVQQPGGIVTACQPLLQQGDSGACQLPACRTPQGAIESRLPARARHHAR